MIKHSVSFCICYPKNHGNESDGWILAFPRRWDSAFFFKFYFIFKLYIIVLVLPNVKMNPPQVYM